MYNAYIIDEIIYQNIFTSYIDSKYRIASLKEKFIDITRIFNKLKDLKSKWQNQNIKIYNQGYPYDGCASIFYKYRSFAFKSYHAFLSKLLYENCGNICLCIIICTYVIIELLNKYIHIIFIQLVRKFFKVLGYYKNQKSFPFLWIISQ